jgi:hypothetical protein
MLSLCSVPTGSGVKFCHADYIMHIQGKARQGKANHFNVINICYRKIFLWATTQVNKDKYESKND